MLAKRPEDRYATPAEVAAELTPFCEGHDLAALVHGYRESDGQPHALRQTRVDSGASVDTWLSRASHLYPSRRWLLRRALPALLVAGAFAGLAWTAYQARQRTIANAMQQARDTLPIAAETAEDAIGEYVTKRFRILQEAAAEEELQALIESFSAAAAEEELEDYPLAQWIKKHRQDNMDRSPSDSWFLNDPEGTQISRHPLIDEQTKLPEDSFLQNFAYRDYFHGLGKDLPQTRVEPIQPIQVPNLSAVYMSSTTGKLKVAFSTPVWSKPVGTEAPTLLAELSMSVELGTFEVLNKSVQRGKDIVLVDLREDFLDPTVPTGQRGLILNHPLLPLWKDKERPPRVRPEVLAALESSQDRFLAGYQDPLAIQPGAKFWGVFEPVTYKVHDVLTDSTKTHPAGWVVLVQTPAID